MLEETWGGLGVGKREGLFFFVIIYLFFWFGILVVETCWDFHKQNKKKSPFSLFLQKRIRLSEIKVSTLFVWVETVLNHLIFGLREYMMFAFCFLVDLFLYFLFLGRVGCGEVVLLCVDDYIYQYIWKKTHTHTQSASQSVSWWQWLSTTDPINNKNILYVYLMLYYGVCMDKMGLILKN